MATQHLFGLDGLTELGVRTGADMRPTLLRVLTDLYVHRLSHTADEERHYTELALRLLDAVDVPTRVAVARRFAGYMSPPLRVLQWLTRDLPEVRAQLRSHPLLQPFAPAGKPASRSAAIAASEDAAPHRKAAASSATIAPLDATKAAELTELFFAASAIERRLILLNLNVVAPVSPGSIRVMRDISVSQRLEAAALGGNREGFAQHLAQALKIPREQAARIVRDELGEPVTVAAKALSMPREVLYRVLLFVNLTVGHSVERVHALAALNDEITQAAAEGMVAIWQALRQQDRIVTTHQPLAWDDETRQRARPAVAAAPRIPVTQRTSGRRNAS
jgi:hypothetical protein